MRLKPLLILMHNPQHRKQNYSNAETENILEIRSIKSLIHLDLVIQMEKIRKIKKNLKN